MRDEARAFCVERQLFPRVGRDGEGLRGNKPFHAAFVSGDGAMVKVLLYLKDVVMECKETLDRRSVPDY